MATAIVNVSAGRYRIWRRERILSGGAIVSKESRNYINSSPEDIFSDAAKRMWMTRWSRNRIRIQRGESGRVVEAARVSATLAIDFIIMRNGSASSQTKRRPNPLRRGDNSQGMIRPIMLGAIKGLRTGINELSRIEAGFNTIGGLMQMVDVI
ncbi:hypothetical protein M422DRAFT_69989 [Sphaerobolus stellatus SS14]|uniref:Uncharacterized protein n=1 Tax=Sphaerobolus stellatus (strain SS14) TaxID=990650 RepID=A0A0C9VD24_SPHS4|nr:hypothetical protein M422DRAFT_69989 [Sphaerobolus stellatus SS14]